MSASDLPQRVPMQTYTHVSMLVHTSYANINWERVDFQKKNLKRKAKMVSPNKKSPGRLS